MAERRLLLRDIDVPDIERIDAYMDCGGYRGVEKMLSGMSAEQVVEEVGRAGLHNRGGAWYPLADRWRTLTPEGFLCVDANESEPGTFRDRKLIERHPHQLVEGVIIAAYAIGARVAYIYIRSEMSRGRQLLARAIDEARERGLLGKNIRASGWDLDIYLHVGGGAYIAGEPTAMLHSLEGKRAEPQAIVDEMTLFGRPALVENAGTLAYLPHIIERGATWFRKIGTERYPGTCVFCVSGHVRRPGLYELELGSATLRQIVDDCSGGVREGHALKGVIPGGASSPVLAPDQLDVRMSPEDWAVPGGGAFPGTFGTGGIIVMDETTCMVDAALNLLKFYARESCGKCVPCREGVVWLHDVVQRLEDGRGRLEDLELLESVAAQVSPLLGKTRSTLCAFGPKFAWSLSGFLHAFREEFEQHVAGSGCPLEKDRRIKVPETVSVRF